MKLLIHAQTSTVAPLTFYYLIYPTLYRTSDHLSMLGLKVDNASKEALVLSLIVIGYFVCVTDEGNDPQSHLFFFYEMLLYKPIYVLAEPLQKLWHSWVITYTFIKILVGTALQRQPTVLILWCSLFQKFTDSSAFSWSTRRTTSVF